jgi:hypothetical protein
MTKEKCKICGEIIELEERDKIRICYREGHITQKQLEEKQRREDEKLNEGN